MAAPDPAERGKALGTVVVGAGLVGPVMAMYLAGRFGPVTVLERRGDPRREPAGGGRSLTVILSARGWRVLGELGVAERVREICVPLKGRLGHLPDGDETFTPYGRNGQPIWAVERERLARLLLDAAEATPGVELRFRRRVSDVDLDAPALCVDGRWTPCTHVLGCDGARSAVRAAMVARGAAAGVREDVDALELAYQEINLPLPGCDRNTMHYWPTGDALFGAFPTPSPERFTGSVFYRLHGPPPSYASIAAGRDSAEQFAATFPGLAAVIPDLAEQLAAKPMSTVPLVRCNRWVWRGNVALVGDSCHAMAPFMGQGMNCAFEDARTLVSCLDRMPGWADAFAAYERARKADGDAIADISYAHYRTMSHPAGRADDEATGILLDRLSDLFPERFVPLYERCAFTEESYAAAREQDRHLHDLVRNLLRRYGTGLLDSPDDQLARCVAAVSAGRPTQLSRLQECGDRDDFGPFQVTIH
jgi:kynurenine 3-monooxygenase